MRGAGGKFFKKKEFSRAFQSCLHWCCQVGGGPVILVLSLILSWPRAGPGSSLSPSRHWQLVVCIQLCLSSKWGSARASISRTPRGSRGWGGVPRMLLMGFSSFLFAPLFSSSLPSFLPHSLPPSSFLASFLHLYLSLFLSSLSFFLCMFCLSNHYTQGVSAELTILGPRDACATNSASQVPIPLPFLLNP